MGPVERELRESGAFALGIFALTSKAWCVLLDARDSLGIRSLTDEPLLIPDALSEAVEAAEALGL